MLIKRQGQHGLHQQPVSCSAPAHTASATSKRAAMASMQRRTAKPGSVGSRHKAAASRLRSLQDVIGQHCPRVANICSMIGKSRCCSEYSVLNLLLSISGANLGPGTVISVSPLHTWQINGIRHWTCTAAPSNSNKSGAYAFFESCQSEAEAALQNRGFQVFRDGTKIGLIDPSVSHGCVGFLALRAQCSKAQYYMLAQEICCCGP